MEISFQYPVRDNLENLSHLQEKIFSRICERFYCESLQILRNEVKSKECNVAKHVFACLEMKNAPVTSFHTSMNRSVLELIHAVKPVNDPQYSTRWTKDL